MLISARLPANTEHVFADEMEIISTVPTIIINTKSAKASFRHSRRAVRPFIWLTPLMAISAATIFFCGQSNAKTFAIQQITSNAFTINGPGERADGSSSTAGRYDHLGMQKLAEMAAFARHNEDCGTVPRKWSIAFIVLIMTNPPREAQVEAQEKKLLALRRRVGRRIWCALYRVNMHEAYLVYRYATRQ